MSHLIHADVCFLSE